MSKDTIPAPPINPSTGELVTYEMLADRFDQVDQRQEDMRKAMLNGFAVLGQRLIDDAMARKELLESVLELARDNRRRIEELERWRMDHEDGCERKSVPGEH